MLSIVSLKCHFKAGFLDDTGEEEIKV